MCTYMLRAIGGVLPAGSSRWTTVVIDNLFTLCLYVTSKCLRRMLFPNEESILLPFDV